MTAVLVVLGIVLVALVVLAAASIKVVREYQRVVLFRLGRASGARGPGLVVINPITDRISSVDLREQYLEIPHQTAITQDNAAIAIDFIIFYKVIDPLTTVLAVKDFKGAGINIASTTLRSVVGDMTLDDVLSKREQMNSVLRLKLDDVTERWGVKVTNVEVREIKPPPAVLEAMTRQMGAERARRPSLPRRRDKSRPPSPWPRVKSNLRSCRPRASARRPSCVPKASPPPSNGYSKSPETWTRRR